MRQLGVHFAAVLPPTPVVYVASAHLRAHMILHRSVMSVHVRSVVGHDRCVHAWFTQTNISDHLVLFAALRVGSHQGVHSRKLASSSIVTWSAPCKHRRLGHALAVELRCLHNVGLLSRRGAAGFSARMAGAAQRDNIEDS